MLDLESYPANEIYAEAELEVGERAEGGVGFVDLAVDEGGGVSAAEFEDGGEAAVAAFEVIVEVEGHAAGGETVGFVA